MMKKLIIFICLALSFVLISANVYAAPPAPHPAVIDNADLLTEAEESTLENTASRLRDRGFDVVILTMTGGYGGKGVVAYSDDYFDYNGYGVGTDRTGVLFLVNLTERDLYISTSGDAIRVLNDRGIDMLLDTLAPHFTEGEYYYGFKLLLSELEYYLTAYENGAPIGSESQSDYLGAAAVCLVIGFIIAILIMLGIKNGMNTARLSRDAVYAIDRNSFRLSRQRDVFLYSRTRRIPRSDSSSSGSSTHRSSSGRSHGGGGRKF